MKLCRSSNNQYSLKRYFSIFLLNRHKKSRNPKTIQKSPAWISWMNLFIFYWISTDIFEKKTKIPSNCSFKLSTFVPLTGVVSPTVCKLPMVARIVAPSYIFVDLMQSPLQKITVSMYIKLICNNYLNPSTKLKNFH